MYYKTHSKWLGYFSWILVHNYIWIYFQNPIYYRDHFLCKYIYITVFNCFFIIFYKYFIALHNDLTNHNRTLRKCVMNLFEKINENFRFIPWNFMEQKPHRNRYFGFRCFFEDLLAEDFIESPLASSKSGSGSKQSHWGEHTGPIDTHTDRRIDLILRMPEPNGRPLWSKWMG